MRSFNQYFSAPPNQNSAKFVPGERLPGSQKKEECATLDHRARSKKVSNKPAKLFAGWGGGGAGGRWCLPIKELLV